MTHPKSSSGLAFLNGGGEMQKLIESQDWSGNPLGAPASWPQSLRTAVSICLRSSGICALYWGPDFRMLYNDAYAPALAERHPQALGRPISKVWAEIADVLVPQLETVVKSGRGFAIDRQRLVMHRNGQDEETFWLYNFVPATGEDGQVAGVFVSAVEITAQLKTEQEATASRQALRELNESLAQQVADRTADRNGLWQLSSDLMLVATVEGVITSANPAWRDVLGWTLDELVGMSVFDLIHPNELEEAKRRARSIANRGNELTRFERRYRHKDGSYRLITWSGRTFGDSLIAVGRDDTAQKESEAELARAQDQLRQSQKMEAVGQLTNGLAHDFNNLLQVMMGNLDLLQVQIRRGHFDELGRYITGAKSAGQRAAALTQRLLAFSRRQTPDPQPTDVNQLLGGLEEMLQRTVGPSIRFTVSADMDLWHAMLDAAQFENSILNLCINARDAMPQGGSLVVATSNQVLDEREAGELGVQAGQYLSIRVTDSGTGMSAQIADRAFEPFFTTKPVGEGTGLGLSMTYGFARQSNGHARIESEPGKGTTVELLLPRYLGGAARNVDDGAGADDKATGRTVLVVDDETSIVTFLQEALQDQGYTVLNATDGPRALEIFRSTQQIDLLVTDVGLPNGMNGRQLADAVRVLRPALKVLFITGYAATAAFGSGRLEPGMKLLTKPFSLDDLAEKVSSMVG